MGRKEEKTQQDSIPAWRKAVEKIEDAHGGVVLQLADEHNTAHGSRNVNGAEAPLQALHSSGLVQILAPRPGVQKETAAVPCPTPRPATDNCAAASFSGTAQ